MGNGLNYVVFFLELLLVLVVPPVAPAAGGAATAPARADRALSSWVFRASMAAL